MASGGQKVAFSASTGLMKRSQSDSKLYHEEEEGEDEISGDELFGGSVSNLHGTYTKNPGKKLSLLLLLKRERERMYQRNQSYYLLHFSYC